MSKYKIISTMLDGTTVEDPESYLFERTEDNKYLFDAYVDIVYERIPNEPHTNDIRD